MTNLKMIIVLSIISLTIIVLAQNAQSIEAQFLFWEFSTSAFVMYLIFYIAGVISAFLAGLWRKI